MQMASQAHTGDMNLSQIAQSQPIFQNALHLIQQYMMSQTRPNLSPRQNTFIDEWQRRTYLRLKNQSDEFENKKKVYERLVAHKASNTYPKDIQAMYRPYPNLPTCLGDEIRTQFVEMERMNFLELQTKVLDSRINYYKLVVDKLSQNLAEEANPESLLQELLEQVPILKSFEVFASDYVSSVLDRLQQRTTKQPDRAQDKRHHQENQQKKMDIDVELHASLAQITKKLEQLEAKLNAKSKKSRPQQKTIKHPKAKKASTGPVNHTRQQDRNFNHRQYRREFKVTNRGQYSRYRDNPSVTRQQKNVQGRGYQRWDQEDHRHDQMNHQRNRPTYASIVKGTHRQQANAQDFGNRGKRRM
jgi:hypothetical protein